MQIVDVFRAKIIDVSTESIIIEITGDEEKITALLAMLKPFGLKEMCRTGIIAMEGAASKNRQRTVKRE